MGKISCDVDSNLDYLITDKFEAQWNDYKNSNQKLAKYSIEDVCESSVPLRTRHPVKVKDNYKLFCHPMVKDRLFIVAIDGGAINFVGLRVVDYWNQDPELDHIELPELADEPDGTATEKRNWNRSLVMQIDGLLSKMGESHPGREELKHYKKQFESRCGELREKMISDDVSDIYQQLFAGKKVDYHSFMIKVAKDIVAIKAKLGLD
jgi:hypothetical protein